MLRVLELAQNPLGVQGIEALLRSPWSQLEELGLSRVGLDVRAISGRTQPAHWFKARALVTAAATQVLPALKRLALEGQVLNTQDLLQLTGARWRCLETLDSSGNQINPGFVAMLAPRVLHQMPALCTIKLGEGRWVTPNKAERNSAWLGFQLVW